MNEDRDKKFRCSLGDAGVAEVVWVYVHVGNAATLFELGKRFAKYDGAASFWCNQNGNDNIASLRVTRRNTAGTTVGAAAALGELIAEVEAVIG